MCDKFNPENRYQRNIEHYTPPFQISVKYMPSHTCPAQRAGAYVDPYIPRLYQLMAQAQKDCAGKKDCKTFGDRWC